MSKDESLPLVEALRVLPDIMHARITPIAQRETEYVLPASLKFRLEAALSASGLEAENARLRKALEWYREQAEGCRKLGSIGDPFRHALDRDGGNRAAEALKQEAQHV